MMIHAGGQNEAGQALPMLAPREQRTKTPTLPDQDRGACKTRAKVTPPEPEVKRTPGAPKTSRAPSQPEGGGFFYAAAPTRLEDMAERIPEDVLQRWRLTPCEAVLEALGLRFKRDASRPAQKPGDVGVHVEGARFIGELVLTGPKFYCPREGKGGAGGLRLLCPSGRGVRYPQSAWLSMAYFVRIIEVFTRSWGLFRNVLPIVISRNNLGKVLLRNPIDLDSAQK